jgi:transketolase
MLPLDNSKLKKLALDYCEAIIRMSNHHSFGIHVGGSLSLAEVLTVLYFHAARVDPQNPDWPDRDRIVLSKGHANIGLLTTLMMKGFFLANELDSFNTLGSSYTMHADSKVPGVEHSAGSLGHGLSVAVGMALAARLDKASWNVYCILGDGESMEGSVWEAMMSAGHFQLANLTAVLDRNQLSQEGTTKDVMDLDPVPDKARAFGWEVFDIDGHSIPDLRQAFDADTNGKPKFIIANTIKGKGIPTHQNQVHSHFASLSEDEMNAALQALEIT